MALVNCPECGREKVSDSAEACPDCGYGVKAHFEKIKFEEEKRKLDEKGKLEDKKHIILEKTREEELQRREKKEEEVSIIEKLQANIKESKKATIIVLVWSILWTAILIISFVYSFNELIIVIGLICSIIGWFIFCVAWAATNDLIKDIELAQKNIDEYKRVKRKREEVAHEAEKINDARRREEEALKHPKCPNCGSTNTQRISTLNRAVSIGAVGLASSKIGKQYECKNCKHMW